eukprot:1136123-Pelagomonas_calceolata.AAC.4
MTCLPACAHQLEVSIVFLKGFCWLQSIQPRWKASHALQKDNGTQKPSADVHIQASKLPK